MNADRIAADEPLENSDATVLSGAALSGLAFSVAPVKLVNYC